MHKEDTCPFCKALNEQINCYSYHLKNDKRRLKSKFTFKTALVTETYCNDNYIGRSSDGLFSLNHCPVCGAKITINEISSEC